MYKISPNVKQKVNKKVKFDSARVSFQVEYDIPDDRRLRTRIPVWTEHWKRSKSSLALHLLRSLSCGHWFRCLVFLLAFCFLLVHVWRTVEEYARVDRLIADYSLPLVFHLPDVSLCIPIVVPIVEQCVHRIPNNTNDSAIIECRNAQTLRQLFNQSLSPIGHRCLIRDSERAQQLQQCSRPKQWIHKNRKCFTYSHNGMNGSTAGQLSLNILIQENAHNNDLSLNTQLFIHATQTLPLDEEREEAILIHKDRDLNIRFFATTLHRRQHCQQNPVSGHHNCLLRCLLDTMRRECAQKCISRFTPIPLDLLLPEDMFCSIRDHQNACNSHEYYHELENTCHARCQPDCQQTTFEALVSEHLSRDASESNISLTRRLTPDLTLRMARAMTCEALVARLGGLFSFFFLTLWLFYRILALIDFLFEFLQIYCFNK